MMPESTDSPELLISLLTRAQELLNEVQEFHAFLQSNANSDRVEMRRFQNDLKSEVKSLSRVKSGQQAISGDGKQEARRLHMLHSTNLLCYEAVWDAAKQCQGVKAFGPKMYRVSKTESEETSSTVNEPVININGQSSQKRKNVLVDVVARDGLGRVVSTINPKRIHYEIATEGWETYADSEDEESHSDVSPEKP
jgi:hypothetical protein